MDCSYICKSPLVMQEAMDTEEQESMEGVTDLRQLINRKRGVKADAPSVPRGRMFSDLITYDDL
eukprot:scaffold45144_cov31-Prasinocladus_malaysianus.AAC.1